jgi:plastocyanin
MNDSLDPISGPTSVLPGVLGGVETPMAYSDGMLYLAVLNLATTYTPTGLDFSTLNISRGDGELVAINTQYGHIAWQKEFKSINVGGATVVNDVVFTATFDGTIYAYNKYTGEQLFTYKAPAGINAWPAVSGDTIIWPCGVGAQRALLALRLNAGPSVTITSPADDSSVPGPDVTVSVNVSRFNLVDKLGQPSVPGEGHLHYFLDVAPPTTPGQIAVTAPGTYVATTATSNTWTGLSAGQHMLSVELVNNDHTPLVPAVTATVYVNVVGTTSPTLKIVTPAEGAMISGGNVTISVSVTNFNLVNKLGQPNVAGEGHLHYFMDVTPPTAPGVPAITAVGTYVPTTATSYTWTNVTPGMHMFSVELVNNDHTPLVPPVVAFVNVTTMAATGATTIYLSAQNIAFNLSTISVAAGSEVTVVFENLDSGIPHNFAVYTDSSATTIIFQGALVVGVATTTYTFGAPMTPGSYFFRCDVHPTQMTGTFVVV